MDDVLTRAQATYSALKREAKGRYREGHYYALAGGKVVADDATERGVRQQVDSLGLNDKDVMIEQVENNAIECNPYPGWFLFSAMAGHLVRVMTSDRHPE